VGPRHDEQELLDGAVQAVLEHGLAELTFGRLAKRLSVTDRMLVYYFTNKETLFEAVLGQLAGRLLERLELAFGQGRAPAAALLRRSWPVLTDPEADRIFAAWFEFAGQAAAGHEPQRRLAAEMTGAWIDWLAERVDARTTAQRRSQAIRLVAMIDGALLLHHLGFPAEATQVITTIGRAMP